jgi:DNA-binding transcriptional ArsR family regulator
MATTGFDEHPARKLTAMDFRRRATQLRALADPARLRLMACLLNEEKSVCVLADEAQMSIYMASHHLSVLRGARLLATRRQGKYIFYSVPPEFLANSDSADAARRQIDLGWCQFGLLQEPPQPNVHRRRR